MRIQFDMEKVIFSYLLSDRSRKMVLPLDASSRSSTYPKTNPFNVLVCSVLTWRPPSDRRPGSDVTGHHQVSLVHYCGPAIIDI